MEQKFQVGAIASTHGVRGEVKVFPTTDEPAKFKTLKTVLLDTGKEVLELEIESVKFFKNMVILKFRGIDNINDVEKYKGKTLWVDREHAVKLGEDEYYRADLMGVSVFREDGTLLGEITDIMETGANDVYAVTMENDKEVLIPAIKDCIKAVDIDAKKMTVHLLEGLLDV